MKGNPPLHVRDFGGGGLPLAVLHGLFGDGGNWRSFSGRLEKDFHIYGIDLRNHGESPHCQGMDLPTLAAEVAETLEAVLAELGLERCAVLGHSLGGRVAMQLALGGWQRLSSLVIVDIGPELLQPTADYVYAALQAATGAASRREANNLLASFVGDTAVRAYLLKSYKSGGDWRFSLPLLEAGDREWRREMAPGPCQTPALFLRGGLSDAITEENWPAIVERFPCSQLQTIEGAGHWPHADKLEDMVVAVRAFLQDAAVCCKI